MEEGSANKLVGLHRNFMGLAGEGLMIKRDDRACMTIQLYTYTLFGNIAVDLATYIIAS